MDSYKNKNIQQLIILIKKSNSLKKEEKNQMIKKIPQASEVEIKKAIQIFENEKNQWKALKKEKDERLKIAKDFSRQSQKELEKKAKKLIAEKKAMIEKDEEMEAEKLLKTL